MCSLDLSAGGGSRVMRREAEAALDLQAPHLRDRHSLERWRMTSAVRPPAFRRVATGQAEPQLGARIMRAANGQVKRDSAPKPCFYSNLTRLIGSRKMGIALFGRASLRACQTALRSGKASLGQAKSRAALPTFGFPTPDSGRRDSSWGRYGFDGGTGSKDACRGPSPRKSGGTNLTADTQLALAA